MPTKAKTTATKTSTKTAAAKPAAKAAAPTHAAPKAPPTAPRAEPKVVTTQTPVVTAPALAKKELFDLVVERSGIKKKFAKPAVEAALAVLGEAVAEGRELKLPPFGKAKVTRTQDKANVNVIVLRIRQSTATDAPDDSDDDEDDDDDTEGLAPAAE